MRLTVVYIHHNCFILQGLGETLLFDFPDRSHLSREQITLARSLVRGANLCVFASHSHADHFTPAVAGLAGLASQSRFVLSDDVPQMHPEFEPGESEFEIHLIEPDQEIRVGEMAILGLESTDLGVGFLIRARGAVIWFGGDAAEWVWDGADQASQKFARDHFSDTLERLKKFRIDLAFSNADQRLSNWAGAGRFMREVRPRYFVPMHSFGDLAALERFAREAGQPGVETILFERPGQGQTIEI